MQIVLAVATESDLGCVIEQFSLQVLAASVYVLSSVLYNTQSWHEISNNMVCATSKGSDQPVHTRSLVRAFASRINILWQLSYWSNIIWCF